MTALIPGLLVALLAIDEPLRATLLQMAKDDQESVRIAVADTTRQLNADESVMSHILIQRNRELIRQIIQEHGWPGRSLVGDDGARAAWLIVQHQDHDIDFQRRCLTLMQRAFEAGDVGARELAYLTDRVLSNEGKPQMYGTQGVGVLSPEDEARVDANRFAIGLPPWREAVKKRQQDYANGYGGGAPKAP